MDEKEIIESGNPQSLILSIKKYADENIFNVEKKFIKDKNEITAAYEKEYSDFERQLKEKTQEHIEKETAKKNNSFHLKKRKLYLNKLNSFITDMIRLSIDEFSRDREKYYTYYINKISQYIEEKNISEIVLHISENDKDLSGQIRSDLYTRFSTYTIEINLNDEILRGVILEDTMRDVSYNFSIERIMYRKMEYLRKEINTIIKENSE